MNDFELYTKLGLEHIADINAYDHILFVFALCAIYTWKDWRSVIVLVTAFTIGHSLTLALAVLDIVRFDSRVIELLIPITIMLTSVGNILFEKEKSNTRIYKYLTALFFGFIHGLGFSNFLKDMLGEEENIILPLFSFNLGLEVGQLLIVAASLTLSYNFISIIGMSLKRWNWIASSLTFFIALKLLIDQI